MFLNLFQKFFKLFYNGTNASAKILHGIVKNYIQYYNLLPFNFFEYLSKHILKNEKKNSIISCLLQPSSTH